MLIEKDPGHRPGPRLCGCSDSRAGQSSCTSAGRLVQTMQTEAKLGMVGTAGSQAQVKSEGVGKDR